MVFTEAPYAWDADGCFPLDHPVYAAIVRHSVGVTQPTAAAPDDTLAAARTPSRVTPARQRDGRPATSKALATPAGCSREERP